MDTNKMLKEFIRTYRSLLIAEGMNVQESRFELRDGDFVHRETAIAWWAWQASRASMAVELPKDIVTMAGPVLYADDVRAAIEAQGLKVEVKP